MTASIEDPGRGRYCLGDSIPLAGSCTGTPYKIEWSIIEAPPGGDANLSATNINSVTALPTAVGTYRVKFCCFYDNAPPGIPLPDYDGPFIDCPFGVAPNETYTVCITECNPSFGFDIQVTGAANFVVTGNCVTINPGNSPGTVISVVAACLDETGNPITALECETTVYDPELLIDPPEPSEFVCFTVQNCSPECTCAEFSFTVEDCTDSCTSDWFGSVPKTLDKTPIGEEECDPVKLVAVQGIKQRFDPSKYELDDAGCPDCGDGVVYEKLRRDDIPYIIWNSLCAVPGAVIAGDAAFACNCSTQFWCFDGSGTFAITLPDNCPVDFALIKNHNMVSGEVTSNMSIPTLTNSHIFSLCQDKAKIGGFLQPIPVNLEFDNLNTVTLNITGQTANGEPVCIGEIFIGEKLAIPGDLCEFDNPFEKPYCEFESKQNENCRRISRVTRPKAVPWSFSFEASWRWVDENLKPLIRYWCAGNEGIFQHSHNNCPEEVACFDLTDVQVDVIDCYFKRITITGESFIEHQSLFTAA